MVQLMAVSRVLSFNGFVTSNVSHTFQDSADQLSILQASQLLTEMQATISFLARGRARTEWSAVQAEAWQCIQV